MDKPELVAPGVRSFMDFTLRNCRKLKDNYFTFAVNASLTVLFIGVVGLFLYGKYRGKPSKAELEARQRQGQEYIMRKLGTHVATRQMEAKTAANSITGLPIWEKSLLIPGIGNM